MTLDDLKKKGWEISNDVVQTEEKYGWKRFSVGWPDDHTCEDLTFRTDHYCAECGGMVVETTDAGVVAIR